MANKKLRERISKFLDDKIAFHEKELKDFNNMRDRLHNNAFSDEQFNSIAGILKFWLRNRDPKDDKD